MFQITGLCALSDCCFLETTPCLSFGQCFWTLTLQHMFSWCVDSVFHCQIPTSHFQLRRNFKFQALKFIWKQRVILLSFILNLVLFQWSFEYWIWNIFNWTSNAIKQILQLFDMHRSWAVCNNMTTINYSGLVKQSSRCKNIYWIGFTQLFVQKTCLYVHLELWDQNFALNTFLFF